MSTNSSIEWTEATWNPVTGCTKISPGCKHCYAERMANRLRAMGQPRYANGFEVALQHDVVDLPLRWKQPRIIFVNSMSDLFHERVPDDFIAACFAVMNRAQQHTFQVLTKRPDRALHLRTAFRWSSNIWIGTSVETADYTWRAKLVSKIPAGVRFLSVEPLLGPIPQLPLKCIDWVIVGGESGSGCRPMEIEWVRQIRDRCVGRGVPFFFKQWGGVHKSKAGRLLDGRSWDEMPQFKSLSKNGKTKAKQLETAMPVGRC